MEQALRSLPDEMRDVVRLRLFDDLPIAEIATSLGIGESAVRHRFRAGAEIYRVRVRPLLEASSVNGRVTSPDKPHARDGEPETRDGSAAGFR